ncbi:MAG TPA: bifunctional lysylphosphatidylglycerol flippase/synthetase MprF, partial [Crenotrichaceae bacterium]|nr:bifunctional lysylphosphatidylglycerol flippase/synthetase MprF [Crenotrichaceae bacterium]
MESQFARKLFVHLGALLSIIIVCAAFWFIYNALQTISLAELKARFHEFPTESLILAFMITAISYYTITGYDVIALQHIKRNVKYSHAATAAFLASVFGNNIGFAMLTGTSIRYRIYSQIGLSAMEVAAVSSLCALTTILGMSVIFALAMVLQSTGDAQAGLPFSQFFMHYAGWIILSVIAGYLLYSKHKPLTVSLGNWSVRLPASETIVKQIVLATTNLGLIAMLIYVLLPAGIGVSYLTFLGVFAVALIAGSASNVPGGIGVFESVILLGLPEISPAALLASILMFRAIYYLTPLAFASIMFTYHEMIRNKEHMEGIQDSTFDLMHEFGPQILSMLVLVAGIILLLSGSIPIGFDRDRLVLHIPLSVVDLSHLLGAAAGVGLFFSARGISRRLHSAFWLSVVLLITGMMTSLFKGLGFREAIALFVVLTLLWYARAQFYRKASLFEEGFPVEWVTLLSVTLITTIWLGLFSFKDIPYSHELWLQVGFENDYSRFLRSILLVLAISITITAVNLFMPDPLPQRPEVDVLERIRGILRHHRDIRSNLVLLGDKRILFSPSENSFLMYQIYGKSWTVLGNPVGDPDEFSELIWSFQAMCDRYGGWPIFYLVDEFSLPLFHDFNLSFEHIGDDAVVPLEHFSISESLNPELQQIHSNISALGASFVLLKGNELNQVMPELKTVSDSWLDMKQTNESGFSMGFFDPYYLHNFECAIVRLNHRVIAFAVILET